MSIAGEVIAGAAVGTWVTVLTVGLTSWRDARKRDRTLREHIDTRLSEQNEATAAVARNLAVLTPQYQATAATVDRLGQRTQSLAEITAVLEDRTERLQDWARQRDRDAQPDPRRIREQRPAT